MGTSGVTEGAAPSRGVLVHRGVTARLATGSLPKGAGGAGTGVGLTLALHAWVAPEELLALLAGPASEAWHALALPRELPKKPQQDM